MNKGRKVIKCLNSTLCKKNIQKETKDRIYKYNLQYNNVCCRSVGNKILAYEMRFWIRCCRKTRLDKITNRTREIILTLLMKFRKGR